MRFLLLHPDSSHFRNRLADVHPKASVEELVKRKSELIRSLYCGLRALPKRAIESYAVRLYNEFPTWMIQFYDCEARSPEIGVPEVDHLVMMVNMPGRHSKLGPRYVLARSEPVLFNSFLAHFERLWNSAVPINDDGSFPALPTPPPSKIRSIVFDMDGTVLNTNQLKQKAFFSGASEAVSGLGEPSAALYADLSYLHRDRLFHQYVLRTLHRRPTNREEEVFSVAYKRYIKSGLPQVNAMAGFTDFASRLHGRYKLFVASTAPQDEVDALLKAAQISQLFTRTFGFPTSKVKAIQSIVESYRFSPQTILYVGDHHDDQLVAEAAGTHFCRFAANADQVEPGAGALVRTFDEMIGVLFDLELLGDGD